MPQRLLNRFAADVMRLFSLIALCALFFCSCAAAVPVKVVSRFDLSSIPSEELVRDKANEDSFLHVSSIKYLMSLPGSSPTAAINNRSVELCLKGKFPEAEILLLQISASDAGYPAVCNNLGVVYECSGDKKKAREFYLRSSILDPTCVVYRKNLRTADADEK